MSFQVALQHTTRYRYSQAVALGPQVIRLRPAPHCRTPIESYSLQTNPQPTFLNWQQDPFSNYLARCQYAGTTAELTIEVQFVASILKINPFDFFLEPDVERFPTTYQAQTLADLQPYLAVEPTGGPLRAMLDSIDRTERGTIEFLVDLNRRLATEIEYAERLEPGVQAPDQTLQLARGSCRDSTWLLCQLLRHLGLATRFASGYLIQVESLEQFEGGGVARGKEFADLHAWTEVFLPGAGWVGLDPTSGLFAGEGHLPLACTPQPTSAAPITGSHQPCDEEFTHEMSLRRLASD